MRRRGVLLLVVVVVVVVACLACLGVTAAGEWDDACVRSCVARFEPAMRACEQAAGDNLRTCQLGCEPKRTDQCWNACIDAYGRAHCRRDQNACFDTCTNKGEASTVGASADAAVAATTDVDSVAVTMVKQVFAATCPKACGATCTIMFHRCNVACTRQFSPLCSSQCGVDNNNCVRRCQAGIQLAAATLSEIVDEEKEAFDDETEKPMLAAADRSLAGASNLAAMHATITSQLGDAPSAEPCQDPDWNKKCLYRFNSCQKRCSDSAACRMGGNSAAMDCDRCGIECGKANDSCVYCGMGVKFCCLGATACNDGWNRVAAKLA